MKALLGELLEAVHIGPAGCIGDRRWIVGDSTTGQWIANKRGPTDPRLRACRAELIEESDDALPLRITLPDGESLVGAEIEEALSHLLQRPVRLEVSHAPAAGRFAATGAHHDVAPVHLIPTRTLERLGALAPAADWDVRRFRPNLVLDDGRFHPTFAEDALLGARLRGRSGVALTIGLPTPRCVVPTRTQQGLPADPSILGTIVQQHRLDLGPFGRQRCAGAYAEVAHAGRVRVGERLGVEPGQTPPDDVIRTTIGRLVERTSEI